jgi:uncharacterized protein YlxP (DUF503 family)
MPFWIGVAECSLRLPYAGSLKERRHVVRSILDGVRNRFSLSSSDLGPADKWQDADLGFTAAGSSPSELEERLRNLESFLARREAEGEFEIVRFTWEVFAYGDL